MSDVFKDVCMSEVRIIQKSMRREATKVASRLFSSGAIDTSAHRATMDRKLMSRLIAVAAMREVVEMMAEREVQEDMENLRHF